MKYSYVFSYVYGFMLIKSEGPVETSKNILVMYQNYEVNWITWYLKESPIHNIIESFAFIRNAEATKLIEFLSSRPDANSKDFLKRFIKEEV